MTVDLPRSRAHAGRVAAIVPLIFLALAAPALAQNAGSLRVTVLDASRAVVPGAAITLTNEATRFTRHATTDTAGGYVFATLDPGDYTLEVELTGFKSAAVRGLHVSPNDARRADVTLEVGAQSELVQVVAVRDVISTESGAREGLLTSDEIQKLSMMGRNPMELMRILPGVVVPDQSAMEVVGHFSGPSSSSSTTVNGTRGANMMVTLDGAKLQDVGSNNGTLIVPNSEMVSEVKIQTSNYAAEFGNAAVNVLAVTKSGSGEFHGGLYNQTRDGRFATNDRSRVQTGQSKPKSSFNFPGAYLSGPILVPGTSFNKSRSKAFFFLAVELSRQNIDEGSSFAVVPTAGQRQGLFTDYIGGQNLNQSPVVNIPSGFPGAGMPAPGNDLRPYMSATGQALLSLWPQPNFEDPSNRYNYVTSQLSQIDRDAEVLRLDYNLSEATRVYVRLARDSEATTRPRGLWWNSSAVDLPSAVNATSLGRSVSANVVSVLSPSITNEVVFSWSHLENDNRWVDPSKMTLAANGIEGFENPLADSPYVPQMLMVNNYSNLMSGNDVDRIFSDNSFFMVADTFSKVMRSHALKFGVIAERWNKVQNYNNESNARLSFSNDAPGSTGANFGDVLVGRFASALIGTPAATGRFVGWSLEAYAQDSWKLSKRLTFEYGLRFARWTNNQEVNGLGSIFDPARYDPSVGRFRDEGQEYLNGFGYVATGEVSKALTASRPLLFMPRFNVVFDLDGQRNTVVRGGAGIFYNREQGNAQYGIIKLPPNAYATTVSASSYEGLFGGRGLGYDTLQLVDPYSGLNSLTVDSVSPASLDWPRTINASLSVARRLPWRHVLDVGYVGSFGRHLAEQQNFNVIPIGTLTQGTLGNADLTVPVQRVALEPSVVDSQRPFPTLQNVVYYVQSGISGYHSLQATLNRASGPVQYLASYTFSKSLGTLGGDQGTIDPFDPRNRSYGVLATDRTHTARLSWTWQLGNDPARHGWRKGLLNGWHFSGISTYSSGPPIRLGFSGDIVSTGVRQSWWGTPDVTNPIMPVYSCDPRLERPRRQLPECQLHRHSLVRAVRALRPALLPAGAERLVPRPHDLQEVRPARADAELLREAQGAAQGRGHRAAGRGLQPLQPGVPDLRWRPRRRARHGVQRPPRRRAERDRRHARRRLRPDPGLLLHAADDRELRPRRAAARPPRDRLRGEDRVLKQFQTRWPVSMSRKW